MKKKALGLVAAVTIFTAAPALAQVGFYPGQGDLDVGPPAPYYRCGYPCERGYYDYYNRPGVTIGVGPGLHRGWHHDYR